MYKRRRLSAQGIIIAAILILILIAIIFAAANALRKPSDEKQPIDITIEQSQAISVYSEGNVVEMDLEQYLIGVVAAEMPASYEIEALRAQAVAARTYTLYKTHNGGCTLHDGADICTDSSHCQAYISIEEMRTFWNDDFNKYLQKITLAVSTTQGKVLHYDGEEIQVFYHASSGGQTENCENVYSQVLPYLVSVQSEGEENSSNYYGEVSVTLEKFASAMKKFSPSIDIDDVSQSIGKIVRFDSGRIESIEIGSETFTGREIRGVFSLNSANFTIDVSSDIVFSTVGFGHGVGMSQTGANAMAKKGATYYEILTHYYTGVTID